MGKTCCHLAERSDFIVGGICRSLANSISPSTKSIRQRRNESVRKLCNRIDFLEHQLDFSVDDKQRGAHLLHALHKEFREFIRSRQYSAQTRIEVEEAALVAEQLMD